MLEVRDKIRKAIGISVGDKWKIWDFILWEMRDTKKPVTGIEDHNSALGPTSTVWDEFEWEGS